MRRGRRLPELRLSEEVRSTLQGWTRRRKTAQALSMRARIVLRASDGLTATAIAAEVHTCIQTVSKWWRRFDEQGLDLGYHLKTGHTLSVQNRPTGLA